MNEKTTPVDCVSWARRANARWIVHGRLSHSAEAYLNHLEQTDPQRLAQSCRNAYVLAGKCGSAEDPKPWFYGGLFSLARPEEVERFLADHSFTSALVPCVGGDRLEGISEDTRRRMQRIREAIAQAVRESQGQ